MLVRLELVRVPGDQDVHAHLPRAVRERVDVPPRDELVSVRESDLRAVPYER